MMVHHPLTAIPVWFSSKLCAMPQRWNRLYIRVLAGPRLERGACLFHGRSVPKSDHVHSFHAFRRLEWKHDLINHNIK